METGQVVQFNATKGFGFIAPDNGGEDVFVHVGEIGSLPEPLRVGTRVSFEVLESDKGFKAYDLKLLTPTARTGPTAASTDGDTCEVISSAEFSAEITELLITVSPGVTAKEIADVRSRLIASAKRRGWVDS